MNVIRNPSLNAMVGGVASVTLGDEGARLRGTQKTVLERQGPPAFSAVVEMETRNRWVVHHDTGRAVDVLLAGTRPPHSCAFHLCGCPVDCSDPWLSTAVAACQAGTLPGR